MACLPCLFLPALLAGSAGAGGIEAARKKKIWMWVFIGLSVVITAIWIIFLIRKKKGKCKSCSIPKTTN